MLSALNDAEQHDARSELLTQDHPERIAELAGNRFEQEDRVMTRPDSRLPRRDLAAGVLRIACAEPRARADPDHRRARRARLDRPALHRDRHACRGAEACVRHAGLVGRRAGDRAAAGRELEGGRSDDLGVQAAAGREVPRRLRLHRRGREVLDRAHPDRRGPEPDHDLCPPREGDARSSIRSRCTSSPTVRRRTCRTISSACSSSRTRRRPA